MSIKFSTEGGGEGSCTPRVMDGKPDPALSHPHPQEELYQTENIGESKLAEICPYCQSKNFVKRGKRKKKLEIVQLYQCGRCARQDFPSGKKLAEVDRAELTLLFKVIS